VAGFLALSVLAAVGIARVEVDTFTLDYLFPDHTVRRDSDFIESRVGPYTGLDFIIRSNSTSILRPEVMAALASWQRAAVQSGAAGWSMPAAVPGPKASPFPGVTTEDKRSLRVTFGVRMQSARALQRNIEVLSQHAEFPSDIEVNAAGYLPLYTKIVSHVVESQLASIGISFILAFLVIGALLRSVELTLLAFLVNLLPVVLMVGFMGFAGIRIDVATVTTSTIILGLMVDEAVHILYRLEKEGAAGHPAGIRQVMETAGQPLAVTTALVIIGFGVLTLADVRSIVWIGLLVPIGAAAAFAADVMLLPALVILRRPVLRGSATLPRRTVPEPAAGRS
ncbi:MAG: MMPL family transporter, partial [Gammaproteobacteria bacterium]